MWISYNSKLVDFQNLLVMNNLTNIVKSPIRISNRSASLIDVMIAQLLYIKTKNPIEGPISRYKRLFAGKNIEEFQYSLHKENWNEVTTSDESNTSFNIFMNTFRYYFNTAFPLKTTHVNNSVLNAWITKGIIISRNKLRLLCHIKKYTDLSKKSLRYIQNYQKIYRKVISEAKKEADKINIVSYK